MFLDELDESYSEYQKKRSQYNKMLQLKKIQEKKISKINQEVHIRDLVVRSVKPYVYGEAKKHTNTYIQSSEIRIRAQINTLFILANEDHIARNYEKGSRSNLRLKSDKENHITRLSTHEFSFFTEKPLTIQEYQCLYEDILVMAEKIEPNVHVLLSSFAIKDTEGKLINMSLFIEGGKPPIIHAFSKNTASLVDIDYDKKETTFSQQSPGQRVSFHAENITNSAGDTISTGSVFELTTQGGAMYTQAIDVCLDHLLGHSKALISRRILNEAEPDEVFPEQVEQCITSNWIDVHDESVISDTILHADPVRSMAIDYKASVGSKTLSDEAISRVKNTEFPSMEINKIPTGYNLIDPPFGSNCTIEVLQERPAGKYTKELKRSISEHNDQACKRDLPFETESTYEK